MAVARKSDDIVKGYEHDKDNYVVVTDEELEKIKLDEIKEFQKKYKKLKVSKKRTRDGKNTYKYYGHCLSLNNIKMNIKSNFMN